MTDVDGKPILRTASNGARRRWKLIVLLAIVSSAAALFVSSRGTPEYSALAQVLISRQNLAATVSGSVDPSLTQQPDRVAQTQAEIAKSPVVAQRTLSAARVDETWETFLHHSRVSPSPNSDVLAFRVNDTSRERAGKLASEYADQFVRYRRELDTAAVKNARLGLARNLRSLRASGKRASSLYGDLVAKNDQLRTLESLQTGNTTLLRRATDARQVKPQPVRSLILGGLLGMIIGAILAGLAEARDTTIRTTDMLAQLSGNSPLAYLPSPRGARRHDSTIPLQGGATEPYRMLAANLTLVAGKSTAKVVLVTSALPKEGKSTTVANIATALVAGGLRVMVLDADSRAPTVHERFGLPGGPGLFDVVSRTRLLEGDSSTISIATVAHEVELNRGHSGDEAWRLVWADPSSQSVSFKRSASRMVGRLSVVPAGTPPTDPLVTLDNRALTDLLQEVRGSYDFVLLDSPALLFVSDTLPLLRQVDGVVLVAMLGRVRRSHLAEVTRSFSRADVPLLGVVATGQVPSLADTHEYPYIRSVSTNWRSEGSAPAASRR
jgi:Mrp family chromosome partitioning ATPase/capsular polysaccharide biosynthesis protein